MNARIRALTTQKASLDAIARGVVGEVVSVMDKQLDNTVTRLKMEPPPKPGSTYIRTHRYSQGWTRTDVRQTREGLVGTLVRSLDIRYDVFVGGDEQGRGQQEQHKMTGWPLVAEVLRTGYADALRRAIRNA